MTEEQHYEQAGPATPSAVNLPPPALAPQPQPKKRSCLVWLVVLLVVGGLFTIAILMVLAATMDDGAAAFAGIEQAGNIRFKETAITGSGANKIVVVPIRGIITDSASSFGAGDMVSMTQARLAKARSDSSVKAVILRIDSPGGGVTASDVIYHTLTAHRDQTKQPIVACLMDIAASGGYYVAASADSIVAHPTTITGSISVLMPLYDATGLMSKIGVKSDAITSGEYKLLGSPFQEKDPEQRRKERTILTQITMEMHRRFVDAVKKGRGARMNERSLTVATDGRILTSREALALGLVDSIGYFEDAVAEAKRLANVRDAKVVEYERVVRFSDLFAAKGGVTREVRVNVNLPGSGLDSGPKFLYLWRPLPAEE